MFVQAHDRLPSVFAPEVTPSVSEAVLIDQYYSLAADVIVRRAPSMEFQLLIQFQSAENDLLSISNSPSSNQFVYVFYHFLRDVYCGDWQPSQGSEYSSIIINIRTVLKPFLKTEPCQNLSGILRREPLPSLSISESGL